MPTQWCGSWRREEGRLMHFTLHHHEYRVVICPGPLSLEGEEWAAITHGLNILVSGTVPPLPATQRRTTRNKGEEPGAEC